jgi:RND superfamily putative drug exporter
MSHRLRSMTGSLAELPGGRRSKFAVVAIWLVVLIALGPLAGKFEDAEENDPADSSPPMRSRSRLSIG